MRYNPSLFVNEETMNKFYSVIKNRHILFSKRVDFVELSDFNFDALFREYCVRYMMRIKENIHQTC